SATATFTCEKNDDAQTVVATVTEVPTPDATCDEDGVMVHTATVVYGGETYTATQNVRIPATEHSYGEPSWCWSADQRTVTATFTCTKCDGTKIVTENATQEEVSEATATADEVVKYTVTVELNGKTYTTETENITVPGTATGEPGHTDPTDLTDPEQPAGDGLCKCCGEDNSGSFWQRIVGFFHAIIYFFAHLFGLR
ncbi:MAG: hypothetical protein IJM45_07675, partial [Clostridia bacterium]|nr:hypothetical protein [Clostridia bacterium]